MSDQTISDPLREAARQAKESLGVLYRALQKEIPPMEQLAELLERMAALGPNSNVWLTEDDIAALQAGAAALRQLEQEQEDQSRPLNPSVISHPDQAATTTETVLQGLLNAYELDEDEACRCVAVEMTDVRAEAISRARDAFIALRNIIEIGKRDLSNPKYDGYFDEALSALGKRIETGNQPPQEHASSFRSEAQKSNSQPDDPSLRVVPRAPQDQQEEHSTPRDDDRDVFGPQETVIRWLEEIAEAWASRVGAKASDYDDYDERDIRPTLERIAVTRDGLFDALYRIEALAKSDAAHIYDEVRTIIFQVDVPRSPASEAKEEGKP